MLEHVNILIWDDAYVFAFLTNALLPMPTRQKKGIG